MQCYAIDTILLYYNIINNNNNTTTKYLTKYVTNMLLTAINLTTNINTFQHFSYTEFYLPRAKAVVTLF